MNRKMKRAEKLEETIEGLRASIIDIQAKATAAYERGDEEKGKEIDGHVTILHNVMAQTCAELYDTRNA